jgi:hypothetical protein
VMKLCTACENTENSPRLSENTEKGASFRCSVPLPRKLDSVSSQPAAFCHGLLRIPLQAL